MGLRLPGMGHHQVARERGLAMRIGQGFDVHAFGAPGSGHQESRQNPGNIVLGGVDIPHDRALLAHSDGDVLLHALCDALLGAAGLGDIGRHFPDTDPRYRGISSRTLLREVRTLVAGRGLALVNADMTIIAQAPRMAPHIANMIACIAADLACEPGRINVKATTTENLGFTGRGEGIACAAVVLLESSASA